MDYKVISLREFQEILRNLKGAKICTLYTSTKPRIKKGGPTDVTKIARVNGIIGFNYASAVNNQRIREGAAPDFVAEPRKWGNRLSGLPLVSWVNKDGSHNLYLEVKVERVYATEYRSGDRIIPYEEIKPFLYEKHDNTEHQQVDREIILRDYNVKNIISIDIAGKGFIVRWEEE